MVYDHNYRRSNLRAFHLRSKLRRLCTDFDTDRPEIENNSEPTPPLTPVNGDVPRKHRKDRPSTWTTSMSEWSSCVNLSKADSEHSSTLIRYGSRVDLNRRHSSIYDSPRSEVYEPEFILPSRVRFRETRELVPKLAVLPLRTRVSFSCALPPVTSAYAKHMPKTSCSNDKKSSPISPSSFTTKPTSTCTNGNQATKKEKEVDIWDRITHIEPTPIATVTSEASTKSSTGRNSDAGKSRLSSDSKVDSDSKEKRLGDELEKMRRELEKVKRENLEKENLLNQAKLEKLAKTTSHEEKNRIDSCETEIFSTPPSSPQPPTNSEKRSSKTNYSSTFSESEDELLAARLQKEEKFRKELEAELERQKAESSKASALAASHEKEISRQNAEIALLKERLAESQTTKDSNVRRLEEETRISERLKEANSKLTQELETERNRFNEVRNDLQVAIDSISARGPYINMDMPLNDLETRILHNIRLNT